MSLVLPVEIWTRIHAFACTDDGSAGRALSLVSKDWREISAPFKLQSIALVNPKSIVRFLCLLESTEESLRNVQSLFIGCSNLDLYSESYLDLTYERARGLAFTVELFPELISNSWTHRVRIHASATEAAVVRILQRTAGTLHTLHTHLQFIERHGPLYPTTFPHLRALVLHGPIRFPPPVLCSNFPNLRHLRLAPTPACLHKGGVLLSAIVTAAPQLSHLCIPHTACTRKELKRALEHTGLQNLTRLFVEMRTSRRSPSPSFNATGVMSERAKLMQLARDDRRVKIVREKRWWIDVQSALVEWEEVDELGWDGREEVETNDD